LEDKHVEDKHIAVYVMVREDELQSEDGGSYDAPLAGQKAACLEFVRQKLGDAAHENTQVYTRRKDLFLDIERQRVSRLVVQSLDRLGSSKAEIDGIIFELNMAGIELLTLTG
jgi:DNA invertase Pin-like site-specific DNA recombinase